VKGTAMRKTGRPKVKDELRKDNVLRVRVSDKELATIKRMATMQGLTVTGLVRGKVLGCNNNDAKQTK